MLLNLNHICSFVYMLVSVHIYIIRKNNVHASAVSCHSVPPIKNVLCSPIMCTYRQHYASVQVDVMHTSITCTCPNKHEVCVSEGCTLTNY